jgi:hypothetical protein
LNGKCFILVSNTLLHKPFEHKIKSIRDFDFPLWKEYRFLWKTQGGGASAWLCGSSESKGVAILLSKHFAFDINFNFSDKTGRLLTCIK